MEFDPEIKSHLEKQKLYPNRIYHLTDIWNLPSILKHGFQSRETVLRNNYLKFDHSSATVQRRREVKTLQTNRGKTRGLHQMVPFYWAQLNPMSYKVQKDPDHEAVSRLCWLALPKTVLAIRNLEWAFTDGNAASEDTKVYCLSIKANKSNLYELPWEKILGPSWVREHLSDEINKENKRVRCAEILLHLEDLALVPTRVFLKSDKWQKYVEQTIRDHENSKEQGSTTCCVAPDMFLPD